MNLSVPIEINDHKDSSRMQKNYYVRTTRKCENILALFIEYVFLSEELLILFFKFHLTEDLTKY